MNEEEGGEDWTVGFFFIPQTYVHDVQSQSCEFGRKSLPSFQSTHLQPFSGFVGFCGFGGFGECVARFHSTPITRCSFPPTLHNSGSFLTQPIWEFREGRECWAAEWLCRNLKLNGSWDHLLGFGASTWIDGRSGGRLFGWLEDEDVWASVKKRLWLVWFFLGMVSGWFHESEGDLIFVFLGEEKRGEYGGALLQASGTCRSFYVPWRLLLFQLCF